MMAKMPPEVAARLAALETTDEILSDTRNHTPAQIERRRNILRQRIEIDIELEATSAAAEQAAAIAGEVVAFIESMKAKHGAVLDSYTHRQAAAMQRKAGALDEIRKLQAEIVDLDRAHAAVDRDREIATRAIVQGDYVLRGWSEATVPDWDRAVDVLRDAMTALGLKMAVAGPALIQYMDPPARRLTGFRAAIMRPPVLDKNTYKNVRGR